MLDINLEELGLDSSLFQTIVENPEIFDSIGKQTQVVIGKEVNYPLTINKKAFDATLLVHSANLQRLSLLQNESLGTGRSYYVVTGIMNPVKMDIMIKIGDQNVNLIDLLHSIAKQTSKNDEFSKEDLIKHLDKIRFPLHRGMPLFFQQMGANAEEFFKAAEILSNAGGVIQDNRNKDSRLKYSCGLTRDMTAIGRYGPKVTSFEVGTTDPTLTALYKWGQTNNVNVGTPGFVNFGESIMSQFTRLTEQKRLVAILKASKEQQGLTQAEIQQIEAKIEILNKMSTQWASVWGGSQQRWVKDVSGDFTKDNVFDPINVPCGRFGLDVDNEIININLWTNNANDNQEVTTTNLSDALSNAVDAFNS